MKKQMKTQMKAKSDAIEFNKMCDFLEKKWKHTITYSCGHCLQEAYYSEVNDTQGYVTDEELIVSSNHKLHLLTFQTPKFSANRITICFWDYIAKVVMLKG